MRMKYFDNCLSIYISETLTDTLEPSGKFKYLFLLDNSLEPSTPSSVVFNTKQVKYKNKNRNDPATPIPKLFKIMHSLLMKF